MARTQCCGIKKDGTPCQGHALEQFGGLCIAHGPTPEQAHEWRSRGGKNSAAAVRFAKNIAEPVQELLELLKECRQKVLDGTLSAANSNAISNNVKMTLEAYSRAEEAMEKERAEEVRAAAAEHLGVPANLDSPRRGRPHLCPARAPPCRSPRRTGLCPLHRTGRPRPASPGAPQQERADSLRPPLL